MTFFSLHDIVAVEWMNEGYTDHMAAWPSNPVIYEINTWVWLTDLSYQYGQSIRLDNVPQAEIDRLAALNVDAIWLMGVWQRGPATRASALNYIHEYQGALPDVSEQDVIGSAYAIHDYSVEPELGGRSGLARLRRQLKRAGMRLMLDFVPNHVATDHPWVTERPDYFVQGTPELVNKEFFPAQDMNGQPLVIANGRDPYFPGWIDTAQLNAFSQGYREAAVRTLCDIASQADGVRCDMAMLMVTDIFQQTWGWRGVQPLADEFWEDIIPRVRARYPDFLFVAEVYWNRDYQLQQQGFDFTYDKMLYDRILESDVGQVRQHLQADEAFLRRNIRFIENHDEMRAADTLGVERSRPAAVLISTLPGAVLLHDGQFGGRIIKLPVHLRRQPFEHQNQALETFYHTLLRERSQPIFQHGDWHLLDLRPACDNCDTYHNLLAYLWQWRDDMRLVVLNLTGQWTQAMVDLHPYADHLAGHGWRLHDGLSGQYRDERGAQLAESGLSVDLPPYDARIYHLTPQAQPLVERVRRWFQQVSRA